MSNRDVMIFIKHILDNIKLIKNSVKNMSEKNFKLNKDIVDATIRRLEVIGEAVKNIPVSFRNKYPEIPWKNIAGTRDKIIHHYFGVDLEIIWDIVNKDLPELKKKIASMIKEHKNKV